MRLCIPIFGLLFAVACGGSSAAPEPENPTPPAEADSSAANPCNPCAVAEAPAPAPAPEQPAAVEGDVYDRAIGIFVEVADLMKLADGNCDQVAASLSEWYAANGDRHTKTMEELAGRPEEERDEQWGKRMAGQGGAIAVMQNTVTACQGNADFMGVFMKLSPQ